MAVIRKMRVIDPFRLNDWPIKRLSLTLLVIIFCFIWTVIAGIHEQELIIFRQILGIIICIYFPGCLILRILHIYNINTVKSFLYSIGLSISFVMLLGLLSNNIFNHLELCCPFRESYIILIFLIVILILLSLCYFKCRNSVSDPPLIDVNSRVMLTCLLCTWLFSLSVLGTILFNNYNQNTIILLFHATVSIIPVCIFLKYDLFAKTHAFVIFFVSLSLLFHNTLITDYIWGWDVNVEYYFSSLVHSNMFWDVNIDQSTNGLLLITIFVPIISKISGMDIIYIYKILLPMIYSITPIGIYMLAKSQFKSEYIAVLSSFFFMFFYGFIKSMPSKQSIAMLFLVLILLAIYDEELSDISRRIIIVMFSFSLVVSHYGVSYIFVLMIVLSLVVLRILGLEKSKMNMNYCIYFVILTVSWYLYASSGSVFEVVVNIGQHTILSIRDVIENPSERSGIGYATRIMPSLAWHIYKYIYIFVIFLISVGIIKSVHKLIRGNACCNQDFLIISTMFYLFLMASSIMTFGMGTDRISVISMVILSPFAVIGYFSMFSKFSSRFSRILEMQRFAIILLSLFLLVYSLFSTGAIFVILNDDTPIYAISLDRNNWKYWNAYESSEIAGAKWLKEHSATTKISTFNLRSTEVPGLLAGHYFFNRDFIYINEEKFDLDIIIGTPIFIDKSITTTRMIPYRSDNRVEYKNIAESNVFINVINKSNRIYDTRTCWVYYPC